MKPKIKIPKEFPVRPLRPGQRAKVRSTCGTCGLSWDDAIGTSLTPAPSGRCPFEYFHEETRPKPKRTANNMSTTNNNQMSHTKGPEVTHTPTPLLEDAIQAVQSDIESGLCDSSTLAHFGDIVRAVNSHAALLSFSKDISESLSTLYADYPAIAGQYFGAALDIRGKDAICNAEGK